ncbi:MAG: hypothetical protein R6U26_01315 [Candidatus Undinarchaeales archaeon]
MEENKGGAGFKAVLILIALGFLAYGIYGYIYIPMQSSGFGGVQCPAFLQPEGFGTGACLYSLPSLIIGAVLMFAVVGTFLHRR